MKSKKAKLPTQAILSQRGAAALANASKRAGSRVLNPNRKVYNRKDSKHVSE
jgi:hypothetical protein